MSTSTCTAGSNKGVKVVQKRKWTALIQHFFLVLSTTQSALHYIPHSPIHTHSCNAFYTYSLFFTHTHSHTLVIHWGIFRAQYLQYLAQGHFDMRNGGAGDRTTDLSVSGRPTPFLWATALPHYFTSAQYQHSILMCPVLLWPEMCTTRNTGKLEINSEVHTWLLAFWFKITLEPPRPNMKCQGSTRFYCQ